MATQSESNTCMYCYMLWLALKYIHNDAGVLFQAEDGIRELVRSRGLGDVYKRQI